MKHILLSTLIFFAVISTAAAQMPGGMPDGTSQPSSAGGGFLSRLAGLRVTAGITGGDIIYNDDSGNGIVADFGPSLGYMLGLSKDYAFGESIVIQPGIALVGFGSKVVDADYTYNIHYLSFNANALYRTPFRIYAGAGLFLDYGLFGSQSYPSGGSANIFESGGFGRLNTGVNVELGYPINFGDKQADIFGSYRIGMNNVEGDDAETGETTKLRMFTIGVKYVL